MNRGNDRELSRRHRAGDPRAREALVLRYLPLARRLAYRHRRSGEPLDDLFQVASVGLVKAVDRWDPDRGPAFTTFAVPTMLGELRHHVRDATWAVRPPRGLQDLARAAERARDTLNARLGREPTAAELARHLGRPRSDVALALQAGAARFAASLDIAVAGDGCDSATIGDLSGRDDPGYEHVEANVDMERLLSILNRQAREVVRLRFGEDLRQSDIGARLDLSQMHISRILRASAARLEASLSATLAGGMAGEGGRSW
jgi:RNA polymerase sigma-B factor